MKDLYDLWFILEHVTAVRSWKFCLHCVLLLRAGALHAPERPAVFSREFVGFRERPNLLWKGFTRRSKLGDLALSSILDIIKARLEPLYTKMRLMQD